MSPNFLILGPPKCASTSLHFYLGQHPEIYLSKTKETNFFTQHYNNGIEFYEQFFNGSKNAKAIGEATPSYSFLPFAADRIRKHYPNIKLILCFRNPVERAFSNWLMLWDSGVEKADFNTAIQINAKQLKYIDFSAENAPGIWNSRADNIDIGEKWIRTYIQAGLYSQILEIYLNRFPANHIKVIFLEDLKNNFSEIMKELFLFLNVDPNFNIPIQNEKNFYYDRKMYRMVNNLIGIKNGRAIAKYLPTGIKSIFKQKKENVKKIPVLTQANRLMLWDFFKSDVERLEKMTNKDLHRWLPDACLSK